MFDSIGLQELVLIGVVALIVVGPKELPVLMRKFGQWTARLRGMAADFRANFDEMARQSELDELRKEVEALRQSNPLHDIQQELTKPFETGIDPYAPVTPLVERANPDMEGLPAPAAQSDPAPVTEEAAKAKKPRKPRTKKSVAPVSEASGA